jgi:hypothetical protein
MGNLIPTLILYLILAKNLLPVNPGNQLLKIASL